MGRNKKGIDPDSQAALAVVEREREQWEAEEAAKTEEARAISETQRFIGQVQAFELMSNMSDLAVIMRLRRMKESGDYKKAGYSWDGLCEEMNLNRKTLDTRFKHIQDIGDTFLRLFTGNVSRNFNDIKYLAESLSGESGKFTEIRDNVIVYDGEEVEVSAENADEVKALLGRIEADRKAEAKELKETLSAKDRVIKQKDTQAENLHKRIEKLEGKAKERGLAPDDAAFLSSMEETRLAFEGYALGLELQSVGIGDEPSEVSKAAYLTTLKYMQHRITKLMIAATDEYGDLAEETFGA